MYVFTLFAVIIAVVTSARAGDEPYECGPPDGFEDGFECRTETSLMNALGSRKPFFKDDAIGAKCYDFKENMYDTATERVLYVSSPDGGFSISAACPDEDDVITKWSVCVKDAHVDAMKIHCCKVMDKSRIEKVYNASSEQWEDTLLDCDSNAGFQAIYMFPADEDKISTRVVHQCVVFSGQDDVADWADGDNKQAAE